MNRAQITVRESAVVVLFVILAIVMTWPLAANLRSAVAGPGDPYILAWTLHWDHEATFHRPLELFHPPVFHPARYALAFSEHIYGIAIFGFPLFALGFGPLTVYNILMIAGFAFSGYGAWVLARSVTRSSVASLAAGIFFAFVPFRFTHVTHLQHVWAGWLPLMLAALLRFDRDSSRRNAMLFAAAFLMNGLTNVHWFVFGSFASAVTVLFLAALRQRWRDRSFWLRLSVSTALSLLLLLPFLLPYRTTAEMYGMVRSFRETASFSAVPSDWLITSDYNRLLGRFTDRARGTAERFLFPGILPLLLAAAGVLLARREDFPDAAIRLRSGRSEPPRTLLRAMDAAAVVCAILTFLGSLPGEVSWRIGTFELLKFQGTTVPAMLLLTLLVVRFWVRFPEALSGANESLRELIRRSRLPAAVWAAGLWAVLGFLGSFGLNLFFHRFLFEHLEVFRSLRVPARWAMVAYVGLSALIGVGVLVILRRAEGREPVRWRRLAAGAAVCAALLFELRAAPIRWYIADPVPAPVYTWLRTAPIAGAVLELPIAEGESDYDYLLRSTTHGKAIVNGVSGFAPKSHEELIELIHRTPMSDRVIDQLSSIRCSLIVVHADRLGPRRDAVRSWLAREIERGRLTFVRRFDHDLAGDYVFALTSVEPRAALWRAPERADGAGRTPLQNLEVFLSDNMLTFNESTFGIVDVPLPGDRIRGGLTVSGWALSPEGISAVRLRFANGRMVLPAELSSRADIDAGLPWYPRVKHSGFRRSFDAPPGGIDGPTDLQVELIDGAGRATRLDDIWFDWGHGRMLRKSDWNAEEVHALLIRNGSDPARELPQILRGSRTLYDLGDEMILSLECASDGEFVDRLFRVMLGRPVDRAGREKYLDDLARGSPRRRIVDAVVGSEELAEKLLRPGAAMPPR